VEEGEEKWIRLNDEKSTADKLGLYASLSLSLFVKRVLIE